MDTDTSTILVERLKEHGLACTDAAEQAVTVISPRNSRISTAVGGIDALGEWDPDELATLPVGTVCDVLRMERARGCRTVSALSAAGAAVGPVLHSPGEYIDVLVPVGSLDDWDLGGATVLPKNAPLRIPHPTVVSPKVVKARSWLVPPQGATLTAGIDLYEAYAAVGASLALEGHPDVDS
ncbi:hypothetical protein [Streptomyces huasconensis]|uniref:hypothetical protein n=1 Tax=Streptomyces huasconensis TaxID=1854574 RepID=UPI0033C82A8F